MPHQPFPTGYRQKPDPRDKAFPLSSLMKAGDTKPVSKVWKPGPVRDQGNIGACVGFSCWQFLASEPTLHTNAEDISPFHIYGEARKIDEFPDDMGDGTSVRAGLDVLRNMGAIRAYYWAQDAAQVLEYLLTIGPAVLGIRWTSSMFYPDAQGVIAPKGSGGGGHAIFAHSANWKSQYITLRNSWGTGWGKAGECKIHVHHLDMLLKEEGACAAAVRE